MDNFFRGSSKTTELNTFTTITVRFRTTRATKKFKCNACRVNEISLFREVFEETGYSIASKIDPDQFTEQDLNDQVCDNLF
jgi:8-oxo-dGTP pyrophosphatase MutT (NUDIX family)